MTETAHTSVSYRRLQWFQLHQQQIVDDLNELLPQLSSAPPTLTLHDVRKILDHGTVIFIAKHNDKIVGTVLLCSTMLLVGRKDWIEDVVVHEDYRRQGIATKLMDMAHEMSRANGAKSVNLTSRPDRGNAREMYGAMGYKERDTSVFRLTL